MTKSARRAARTPRPVGQRSVDNQRRAVRRGGAEIALQEWVERLNPTLKVLTARRGREDYDSRNAALKREVYVRVRELLGSTEDWRRVQRAFPIDAYRQPPTTANPFRRALASLRENGLEIEPRDVYRIGRQLHYAHQHFIEPELLIGFVHQCGGSDLVLEKYAKRLKEDWLTSEYIRRASLRSGVPAHDTP